MQRARINKLLSLAGISPFAFGVGVSLPVRMAGANRPLQKE